MIRLHGMVVAAFLAAFSFTSCKPEETGTPCTTAADCGAPASACSENTCENKVCKTTNLAEGTKVAAQTAGDCKVNQCDGSGNVVTTNDDTDVARDDQECTNDVCTAGVPSHPARSANSACGTGGLLKCDGAGACVSCTTAADCGADSECQARTCVAGVCGVNNVAKGTALAAQTAGDCKVSQCDGNGGTEVVNADSDVNVDATSCTTDVCTAGVPSNPPVAAGTTCSEGTGALCNGAGACVQCVAATDCPGTDSECQQRTCTAGVCGVAFTAANTPVASQTANDCKKNVCNGAGVVTAANDDADLPNDNNPCTTDTCSAGTVGHTNVSAGQACGTGLVCSGSGTCVGCNTANDCPGSDDECKARTCTNHVCGVTFTPANTQVTTQTPNDCRKNVCDGSGNTVNQNDNADLPADDGNQCTSQTCVSGTPTFPTLPVNTACTQNGGSFCTAAGACVACTAASQCPGTDTECEQRTCTNNVCGTTFTPSGTAVSTQTPGDCKENRCDGAGAIVAVNLNTDLPADDGNQCTSQVCAGGAPAFPAVPVNTACTQNGGSFCSATATCVACTTASQCPGSDTECQQRTCINNVCGTAFAPSGTAVASQTPGDCKENQCNGAGAIVIANQDADLPADDGNQCTAQVCTAGVPSFANLPSNTTCSQNGGSLCDGAGACVGCTLASQCPGSDTACQSRTCTNGACGFSYEAAGTATASQTAGDCKQNECDGSGNIVAVANNADLPADDGNACTTQVCSSGVPTFPFLPVDTACMQNGGSVCSSSGTCVECNGTSQCPGSDTECQSRTCSSGTCGMSNVVAGVQTSSQVSGDCKVNQCDGNGNIVAVNSSTDVPADDGNQCTDQACNAGVATFPPSAANTACSQNGGSFCDGASACVQCTAAAQCPNPANECQTRTCDSNTCGTGNVAAGTATQTQTTGDCKQTQCDGSGAIVTVNFDSDLPVDNNQCTLDVCSAGVAANPAAVLGATCSQNGGTVCDGTGTCVAPPTVASTTPADGATSTANTTVAVTFSQAMNPATITGQTAAGACTGSVQVSLDNFANCIAFTAASATMSGGNTVATFTPAPGLLVNRVYKVRVTTAVSSSSSLAMAAQFTSATGFTTSSPNLCDSSVVISQVYGGGGLSGATYRNDFIELHNRGSTAVTMTNWSLHYASTSGTTWTRIALPTSTIPAGGYFLVQGASGGAVGAALPTPDATSTQDVAGANAKIALTRTAATLPTGSCPVSADLVDFVGFGTANCAEGTAATAASNTTAVIRAQSACADVNNNLADFTSATPTPRNSATAPLVCACTVQNESNAGPEADYCVVQSPLSISVASGVTSGLVYGQLYESGVTEAASSNGNVRAQLGWGLASANPQYQTWTWINATYNVQSGNNDEYQAAFNAPAAGTYRYVYRFSLNQGVSWTVCDQNAGDFGAGSNANLSFELGDMNVLTVTP
jgi:hypothetical protein